MADQAPAEPVRPWWHDGKTITFVTSVFAAIIPLTTAVQAWIEKQQSIEIGRMSANHQIRMDYVNKALTQNLTEDEQERVFSLLARFKDDEVLGDWARERLERAQEKKKELASALNQLQPQTAEMQKKLESLGTQILDLQAQPHSAPAVRQALTQKEAERSNLERRLQENEQRQANYSTRIGAPIIAARDQWFPVVASEYEWAGAVAKANAVKEKSPKYPVEIYRATDDRGRPLYAVTLGGYLPQSEANIRARYARDLGLASDAFAHQTGRWGENLLH